MPSAVQISSIMLAYYVHHLPSQQSAIQPTGTIGSAWTATDSGHGQYDLPPLSGGSVRMSIGGVLVVPSAMPELLHRVLSAANLGRRTERDLTVLRSCDGLFATRCEHSVQ